MVELPFRQWDEEVLRDVEELMEKQNVSVMLAHIERFYACQKRKKIWKEVLDLPVIFQVNAEFFDGRKKRSWLKKTDRLYLEVTAIILTEESLTLIWVIPLSERKSDRML